MPDLEDKQRETLLKRLGFSGDALAHLTKLDGVDIRECVVGAKKLPSPDDRISRVRHDLNIPASATDGAVLKLVQSPAHGYGVPQHAIQY